MTHSRRALTARGWASSTARAKRHPHSVRSSMRPRARRQCSLCARLRCVRLWRTRSDASVSSSSAAQVRSAGSVQGGERPRPHLHAELLIVDSVYSRRSPAPLARCSRSSSCSTARASASSGAVRRAMYSMMLFRLMGVHVDSVRPRARLSKNPHPRVRSRRSTARSAPQATLGVNGWSEPVGTR